MSKELNVQRKCYKSGTYAIIEYFNNGEKIHEDSTAQKNCGTGWFMSLPCEESAKIEAVYPIPDHVLETIEGMQ